MKIFCLFILGFQCACAHGQAIFAHNDYATAVPFHKAFDLKIPYIEVDIFLENDVLFVAHAKEEIKPGNTLGSMYLEPLTERQNEMYELNLMIDLKSEGTSTLNAFVTELKKFPQLTSLQNLHFVVSGNYPPPVEWKKYPIYIWFDGRPNITYNTEQGRRLKLISTAFTGISKWDGNGALSKVDLDKIQRTVAIARRYGVPMRFWGSPDSENAWDQFIKAGVEILNTDHIQELSAYLLKSRH